MSKELVIGSNRHETKVAILEEDQLVEIYFQRANEYSLAGSIHKGKVTRVLPGMQSAFVDLGLERDTFLYVSDFFEENPDIDTFDERPSRGDRRERHDRRPQVAPAPVATVAEPVDEIPDTLEDAEEPEEPEQEVPLVAVEPELGSEAPAAAVPAPETRHPDHGDRDRRRGRRSRRRRGRNGSGGFPDNKYAQPQTLQRDPLAAEAVEQEHEDAEAEVFDTDTTDVIILPGESLAKYRNVSERPVETSQREESEQETTEDDEDGVTLDPESIELADKVFAHSAAFPAEEEQKFEAVKEERIEPAEPVQTAEVSPYQRPSPFVISGAEALELEQATEVEPAHHADVTVSLPQAEEDSEDAASETPEEEEFAIESEAHPEEGEASSEQVQTAEVREGGDRYPHKVQPSGRRMRRRRGGRFQNDRGERGERGDRQNDTPTPAAANGSAPAVEPRTVAAEGPAERPERRRSEERPPMPSITELLKPGQEIIVQIAKEPLGQKGARITSHIALPGRYVVFMPSVNHLGVSRKIASDEERQRLKRILQAHRVGTTGGFIVRTAGEGVPEPEIAADMDFLYKLWLDIRRKAEKRPAPMLLHCDLDIVQRILRDQVTQEFKSIWVDNEEMYENILGFLQRFQPALVNRVKMYTRQAPIFDAFGITQELEKALRPKVWLKSGGYIVINQTEALVAIDINTGKYVGKSNRLEDTIVKTNLEAVKEIVRQIRLRDLGGIIVVDFIDMDERKNRQKVMQALEEAMREDRAPSKILQFNDFGLVAITRKRVKQSLERTLCAPCPYCEGAGSVKSVQTVIGEILVEAQKIARALEGKDVLLRVHPEVAKVLKSHDNKYLEELEEILGRPVLVKGDAALHIEKFDLG